MYQLISLVLSYYEYPTNTVIEERRVQSLGMEWLPAITICDKSAFSASKMATLKTSTTIKTYAEYLTMAQQMTQCSGCNVSEQAELKTLQMDLMSKRGYYQFLTDTERTDIGHGNDLVLDCAMVYTTIQQGERIVDCPDTFKVSAHWFPNFFTCYDIKYDFDFEEADDERKSFSGLELILHLDRTIPGENTEEEFSLREDTGNEVRILFHHNNHTNYTSSSDYLDVKTGVLGDITLEMTERHSLPAPYGICSGSGEDMEGSDVRYIKCLNSQVKDECNCTLASDISRISHITEKPFCEDLNLGLESIRSNRKCIDKMIMSSEMPDGKCTYAKATPCKETKHKRTMNTNTWPSPSQQKSFIQFVKSTPAYPHADGATDSLDDTQLSRFVEDNFLKLRFKSAGNYVTITKDAVSLSLERMFSSIGGTLNLFSGISLFFLLEIIECCVKVCIGGRKTGDRNPPATAVDDKQMETKTV